MLCRWRHPSIYPIDVTLTHSETDKVATLYSNEANYISEAAIFHVNIRWNYANYLNGQKITLVKKCLLFRVTDTNI